MKIVKYTLALASLLLGMVSCSNEETGTTTDGREQVMLSAGAVTQVVGDVRARTGEVAPKVSAFTNRTFKLIVKDKRIGNPFADITQEVTTGTATDSEITVDGVQVNPAKVTLAPLLYWDDLGGVDGSLGFIGIYPATIQPAADPLVFQVGTQTSTIDGVNNANDLMLAYCDSHTYKTNNGTAANLPFEHKMAKVTLNIKGGEADKVSLEDLTVVMHGFKGEVAIDLDKKTVVATETAAANITPFKELPPVSTDKNATYTAIVAPTGKDEIAAKTKIATITAKDGNVYEVTVSNACTLEAGKNNIFNVTLNKSNIAATATITNWGENVISNGTSQLIEVAPALVNEDGIEEANKVTENSTLIVSIKDHENVKHTVTYTATKNAVDGKLYWIAGTMIYWDDVAFGEVSNTGVTADAILKLGGSEKPEDLFAATQLTNIAKYATNGTLKFEMKHALSKVIITINTTAEGSSDRVSLSKIAKVELPKYYEYTVNATAPFITKKETVSNINVTKTADKYEYTTYILPQTVAVGIGIPKASLIDVTVGTAPDLVNVYQLTTIKIGEVAATSLTFEANKIYNITMTLKKSDIAATAKVTIAPWEVGSNIEGDGEITQ